MQKGLLTAGGDQADPVRLGHGLDDAIQRAVPGTTSGERRFGWGVVAAAIVEARSEGMGSIPRFPLRAVHSNTDRSH